jgi:hypothetical protein
VFLQNLLCFIISFCFGFGVAYLLINIGKYIGKYIISILFIITYLFYIAFIHCFKVVLINKTVIPNLCFSCQTPTVLAMLIAGQWEGHERNYHTYLVYISGYPLGVFTLLIIYYHIVPPLDIIYKLPANLAVSFKFNFIVSSVFKEIFNKFFVCRGPCRVDHYY